LSEGDAVIMARKGLQAVIFQCNDGNCSITRYAKQAPRQWATFLIPQKQDTLKWGNEQNPSGQSLQRSEMATISR